MSAFAEELLASFIVNEACDWVRKGTAVRIFRCATTDGIALNHPSAAEPENTVQTRAQNGHFGVSCRTEVGAAKGPRGHKRSILLQEDAIVNESVIEQ
jgi:hypothetical protein